MVKMNLSGWKQYLAVFTFNLGVLASGSGFVWMEPLIADVTTLFNLTPSEFSWVVASIEYGELLGTLPAGILADRFGRKWLILSTGPIALVSWVLVAASRHVAALYAVRLLQGINFAILFGIGPLYIAEVAAPNVRGLLSGQFQAMWSLGMLFSYLTGHYLRFNAYISVCALIPLLFTLTFAFMPETPYYFLMIKKEEDARRSLKWLRGVNDSTELEKMKKSVDRDMENKGTWSALFATSKDRKIFITVNFLCGIKYLLGTTTLTNYAADTFSRGSGGHFGNEATVIYGVILWISSIVGSFLSDTLGRKCLLIGSCIIIGVSYCVTTVYFYLLEVEMINMTRYSWLMYGSIGLSAAMSHIGPSSLLQTVQGELFPSHTRAVGNAIVGITASVTTFVALKQYQEIIDITGTVAYNFVIFAGVGFFGATFLFFVFKETAGKSLGEIQVDLKTDSEVVE